MCPLIAQYLSFPTLDTGIPHPLQGTRRAEQRQQGGLHLRPWLLPAPSTPLCRHTAVEEGWAQISPRLLTGASD